MQLNLRNFVAFNYKKYKQNLLTIFNINKCIFLKDKKYL